MSFGGLMMALFLAAVQDPALLEGAGGSGNATPALSLIKRTLDKDSDQGAARLTMLREAAAQVARLAPTNVVVKDLLEKAEAEAARRKDDQEAAQHLRGALRTARETLEFKPLMEAKLPKGFPEPTPVGEIRVKHYPAYRLARAAMALGESVAFFTLFNHITRNDIAMTAPVEMTYEEDKSGKPHGQTMAFLYGSQQLGKLGKDGAVEVVDVAAMTTISLGLRGDVNRARVAEARAWLESWLKAHAGKYESAGPLRVMGYNSPMVPSARRYFEVEIPVREK